MRDKHILKFIGMNKDASDHDMPEGMYRDAYNLSLFNQEGQAEGIMKPLRGISLLSRDELALASTHYHMGTFIDHKSNTTFSWFYDEATSELVIFRFSREESTYDIQVECIFKDIVSEVFQPVLASSIVGDELGWTDGVNDGWKIDISRSNRTGKLSDWSLSFENEGDSSLFSTGQTISLEVIGGDLAVAMPSTIVFTAAGGESLSDVLDAITDEINQNSSIFPFLRAEIKNKKVLISAYYEEGTSLYQIPTVTATTTGGLDIRLVEENLYPDGIETSLLKRIKRPPLKAPAAQYVTDTNVSSNTLYGAAFQFQVQYLYKSGSKSAWGPISNLPSLDGYPDDSQFVFNAIDVDFTDDAIDSLLPDLKSINLGVRFGDESELFLVRELKIEDIGIASNSFRFYNDEVYTGVDSAESAKNFDSIPNTWKAEESVASKNGEGERIVLANYQEGYDNHETRTKLFLTEGEVDDCSGYYNISFGVDIINADNPASFQSQPIREVGGEVYFGGVENGNADLMGTYSQYRLPLKGFVGFLAGTNYKAITRQSAPDGVTLFDTEYGVFDSGQVAAINAAQQAGQITSEGIIKNVKPGKYILRIASNFCNQGDGGVYDINGKEYQLTSTFISPSGPSEILLDLPDLPNGGAVDINAGSFIIDDHTLHGDLIYHGYLLDSDGELGREDIEDSFQMEGQSVTARIDTTTNQTTTDHNGFFHGKIADIPADLSFQVGSAPGFTGGNIVDYFDNTVSNLYIGDLGDARNASEVVSATPNPSGYDYRLWSAQEVPLESNNLDEGVILINQLDDYDAYHFDLSLIINDSNSTIPVSGLSVAVEGTGRSATSGYDGQAIIRTYSPNTAVQRSDVNLQVGNDTTYCIKHTTPYPYEVNIQYGPSAVQSINQYLVTLEAGLSNTWKHGDTIHFGLVYYDKWGRHGAVNTNESMSLRIPFPGETATSYKPYNINWEINSRPPTWADSYQWVRTKGIVHTYLQAVIDGAEYVSGYNPDTDEYYYTGYGGAVTEVHLDLRSLTNTSKVSPSLRLGYSYKDGDRIRLVRRADDTYPASYYNVKVLGQIGESLVIDYDPSWEEIEAGDLFEIYTPLPDSTTDTRIYYEFSERYGIAEDDHLGQAQDQNWQNNSARTPATGVFSGGNTFVRQRKFIINEGVEQKFATVEDAYFSDNFESKVQSIGRAHVENPYAKSSEYPNSIRFSNKHYSSDASGTSSFEALNTKRFPEAVGGITSLKFYENVLVAIGVNKTLGIYVGESQVSSGANSNIISLSDEVLGSWNMMRGEHGCIDPAAVVRGDRGLYWLDQTRGKVLRLAADGITAISDIGMASYFHSIAPITTFPSRAGFDFKSGELYIQIGTKTECCIYSEKSKTWISRYELTPEGWGNIGGNRLFQIYGGGLVNMMDDASASLTSSLTVVSSKNLHQEKTYNNIAIRSIFSQSGDPAWDATIRVVAPDHIQQDSSLIEEDFQLVGGQYVAPFLRDENSEGGLINGDRLRGNFIEVEISTQNTSGHELDSIEISYAHSERHI